MAGLNFQKVKTLSGLSGMPQMNNTLNGWEVPLTLVKVIQNVVEGDLVTTELKINFKGVWQPLKDEALELKPEGQRSWEWVWIHARASELNLETGDKVIFNNKRYKVTSKKDYTLNAFVEYQLCRDYVNTDAEID
jgi:hypothetical protein